MVRFFLVGILNAGFGYGCFALFLYIGMHYSVAMLVATVAGVLFNFKTIGILVFRSTDNSLILRFVFSYCIVYLLNIGGIKAFGSIGVAPALAGALLILPMAIVAFILNKTFVFKHE